jgi:DNA-binding response OmpR family regulator
MNRMRVLLVDDETEFVSTLAERLSLRGIEAEWANTSQDALRIAESGRFEVAVLDMKMPEMSGLKLKERLQEKSPGMKFIFLTGYGSETDFRALTCLAGEEFCLVKPVDIELLIGRMEELLHRGEQV